MSMTDFMHGIVETFERLEGSLRTRLDSGMTLIANNVRSAMESIRSQTAQDIAGLRLEFTSSVSDLSENHDAALTAALKDIDALKAGNSAMSDELTTAQKDIAALKAMLGDLQDEEQKTLADRLAAVATAPAPVDTPPTEPAAAVVVDEPAADPVSAAA